MCISGPTEHCEQKIEFLHAFFAGNAAAPDSLPRGTSGSRRGSPHTCRFCALKSAGADGAATQAGSKGGTERAKYKRRFGRSASGGRECVCPAAAAAGTSYGMRGASIVPGAPIYTAAVGKRRLRGENKECERRPGECQEAELEFDPGKQLKRVARLKENRFQGGSGRDRSVPVHKRAPPQGSPSSPCAALTSQSTSRERATSPDTPPFSVLIRRPRDSQGSRLPGTNLRH